MSFPPKEWNYNKIIPGSKESKYNFQYISQFNFELWKKRINESDFISINIEKYLKSLCERHVDYCATGIVNSDTFIFFY